MYHRHKYHKHDTMSAVYVTIPVFKIVRPVHTCNANRNVSANADVSKAQGRRDTQVQTSVSIMVNHVFVFAHDSLNTSEWHGYFS